MIRSPGSNTSLLMLVLLDDDEVSFKACNIKAFLVCVSRLVVSLSRKVGNDVVDDVIES